MLDYAQQECSCAGRGIEHRYEFVGQSDGAQIVTQGAVEGGDHIGHDLDGSVINAVALPSDGVEDLQEVFIEIKDRVGFARFARENGGFEAVHSIHDDVEADAHVADDLFLA
jgi:hypothetical protein